VELVPVEIHSAIQALKWIHLLLIRLEAEVAVQLQHQLHNNVIHFQTVQVHLLTVQILRAR
jgi:hypothetical protein